MSRERGKGKKDRGGRGEREHTQEQTQVTFKVRYGR
jgi:hypothetical protein